jgi:hypothetical protein
MNGTASGLLPTPLRANGGRSISHVTEWRGQTPYHNGKKVQVDLRQFLKLRGVTIRSWSLTRLAEWMMGYGFGWTDLTDAQTPSSRKSRKSSGGQS